MIRRLTTLAASAAALVLVAAPAAAGGFPDEISLADGWQPEGIAAGPGTTAFVGSLADGGIARINLRTGDRDDEFVASATGPAVGLQYERAGGRLWVAGGPSGEVRVYDASSGTLLETYAFGSGRFVNDVAVTRHAAYATDSSNAELLVVPLGQGGTLPDPSDVSTLPLRGDWQQVAGFNANGIEAFGRWLLIPNSTTGQLFAVDPGTGAATELLGEDTINAADGMLVLGNRLYVAQNAADLVSVWWLRNGSVISLGEITDDAVLGEPDEVPGSLDFPTTLAFTGGSLWAVNARFSTPGTPTTPYWITRVPLH